MRKIFSFLMGALMGALVGATLALLLTPVPGKDLQTQMQERFQYIQAEVKNAAAARRAELEKQLAEMRSPRAPQA
jgi:gas vesicle protein